MHRQPLLKMLDRYAATYPNESDVITRIVDLVRARPDCFHRSCRPGHITGSAWIVSADRSKCLLLRHRKLNRWLQPGGHADGQTEVEQVALREAEEETGLRSLELHPHEADLVPLDVDVHLIPERRDPTGELVEDSHEHHDVRFLLVAAGSEAPVRNEESHDLRWFTHEQVLNITQEESVLRLMRKAGPFPTGSG